jgi:hypothetical protein
MTIGSAMNDPFDDVVGPRRGSGGEVTPPPEPTPIGEVRRFAKALHGTRLRPSEVLGLAAAHGVMAVRASVHTSKERVWAAVLVAPLDGCDAASLPLAVILADMTARGHVTGTRVYRLDSASAP